MKVNIYEASYFCHYDGVTVTKVKFIAPSFEDALETARNKYGGRYFHETNRIMELKLLIEGVEDMRNGLPS